MEKEKRTIVYKELESEDGHHFLKKIAVCPFCGKESPLVLPAVSRPGASGKINYYVDPMQEEAELANPRTEQGLMTTEAVKTIEREYQDAQLERGKLLIKIQKARGVEGVGSGGQIGQIVMKGRDDKLIKEGEVLEGQLRIKIDEIGERLRAARVKNNRLLGRRSLRLQQWKNEQARKAAEEAKAKSNGRVKNWRKRLTEVLGK